MRRIGRILLLWAIAVIGCNLTTRVEPTPAPTVGIFFSSSPVAANTPIQPTPQPSPLPTFAPQIGGICPVYLTYSGSDPANKLSLRSQPSVNAPQVLKVPNNTQVFQIPGSQETEGDGYHWLNVVYVDAQQNRYEGWIARDSYERGGVRYPEIATLQPTGQQAQC